MRFLHMCYAIIARARYRARDNMCLQSILTAYGVMFLSDKFGQSPLDALAYSFWWNVAPILEDIMADKDVTKTFTMEELSMLNDAMQLAIASAQRLANRAGQPAAVVEQYKAHKVRLAALVSKLVLTK